MQDFDDLFSILKKSKRKKEIIDYMNENWVILDSKVKDYSYITLKPNVLKANIKTEYYPEGRNFYFKKHSINREFGLFSVKNILYEDYEFQKDKDVIIEAEIKGKSKNKIDLNSSELDLETLCVNHRVSEHFSSLLFIGDLICDNWLIDQNNEIAIIDPEYIFCSYSVLYSGIGYDELKDKKIYEQSKDLANKKIEQIVNEKIFKPSFKKKFQEIANQKEFNKFFDVYKMDLEYISEKKYVSKKTGDLFFEYLQKNTK